MVKEHGPELASTWIGLVIAEADAMCGGKNPPHVLAMFGRMVLNTFEHRSVESIALAIRDGLNGKIYGQLTYPTIAEWITNHEAQIMGLAETEAMRNKFTGDNLGKDYLDNLERDSSGETIRKQQRLIQQLRDKLSNE